MNYLRHLACLMLLGTLLAGCGKPPESAKPAVTMAPEKVHHWKLFTTWPKNYPGLGTAPERLATLVDRMSNGRLKIKVYGAGEVVSAMEVFDTVSRGTAEMGHGSAYYWKGKIPAAVFFTTVPFGLTAQEMNGWLYHGGGLELWREIYAPYHLVPFPAGNTGTQMAGWFNKEIKSLDDLKGLKMRMPGLAGEVLRRAGGTPVTLPGGEIYTSMQTGVIDATEWVGPYNDLSFGLQKVARHYYYPGWHEPGPTLELIVNAEAWASLPPDLQAIVETAAKAVNQDMLDEYTAANHKALQQIKAAGTQIQPLPADVLARFKVLSEQVLQELAAKDPQAKRVYESFNAYRASVVPYYEIAEKAYLEAR